MNSNANAFECIMYCCDMTRAKDLISIAKEFDVRRICIFHFNVILFHVNISNESSRFI